jgi:predicted CoA-binding protein
MVGASTNWKRPSFFVMKYLQRKGFRVIPVNPVSAGELLLGETVQSNLESIPEAVDMVDLFRKAEQAPGLAQAAEQIGAKVLWMQIGVRNELDKIEFEKFQNDFIQVYSTRLNTLDDSSQILTAELIRQQVAEVANEIEEVEMGSTKFTVLDDREGHIPLVINNQVEAYLRYFQGKGRRGFNIWLKRYAQYEDLILPIIKKYELPEELIVLAMVESGLDPKAVSRAKAVGLWQFMYSTGKQYGLERNWYIDERQDPIKST